MVSPTGSPELPMGTVASRWIAIVVVPRRHLLHNNIRETLPITAFYRNMRNNYITAACNYYIRWCDLFKTEKEYNVIGRTRNKFFLWMWKIKPGSWKQNPFFFEGFLFKTRVMVVLSIASHPTVSGHMEKTEWKQIIQKVSNSMHCKKHEAYTKR